MKQGEHFLLRDRYGTYIKARTNKKDNSWYSLEIDDEDCKYHDPFLSDLGLREFDDLVKDVEGGYYILVHKFTPISYGWTNREVEIIDDIKFRAVIAAKENRLKGIRRGTIE